MYAVTNAGALTTLRFKTFGWDAQAWIASHVHAGLAASALFRILYHKTYMTYVINHIQSQIQNQHIYFFLSG